MGERHGINAHLIDDAGLELLAQAGIRWARIDFDWDQIQPTGPDEWRWEDTDRIVAAAGRLGMSLLGVLAYSPAWACGSDNRATPPSEPQRYLTFVRACVERYGIGHVAAWSIWNEPNLKQFWTGERDQFIEDIWVPGLKEIETFGLSVGPDLSSAHDNKALQSWLPACLVAGRGLLDVVSHHQYDGHDTVAGRVKEIERLRDTVRKYPGFEHTPIWITEIGKKVPVGQAEHLAGVMAAMKDRQWWTKTFWYDSHGQGWGLLQTEQPHEPKGAYHTYAQIAREE